MDPLRLGRKPAKKVCSSSFAGFCADAFGAPCRSPRRRSRARFSRNHSRSEPRRSRPRRHVTAGELGTIRSTFIGRMLVRAFVDLAILPPRSDSPRRARAFTRGCRVPPTYCNTSDLRARPARASDRSKRRGRATPRARSDPLARATAHRTATRRANPSRCRPRGSIRGCLPEAVEPRNEDPSSTVVAHPRAPRLEISRRRSSQPRVGYGASSRKGARFHTARCQG